MTLNKPLWAGAALALLPGLAFAQEVVEEAAVAPTFDEIGPYIMTTLLFLIGGFLVMWMAAGFAMLEAGLVRSKNVTMRGKVENRQRQHDRSGKGQPPA